MDFYCSHSPKSKSPPQDVLLKLEKEQTFKNLAEESSMFTFSLGLSESECSLLMNGLVFDSSEVIISTLNIFSLVHQIF